MFLSTSELMDTKGQLENSDYKPWAFIYPKGFYGASTNCLFEGAYYWRDFCVSGGFLQVFVRSKFQQLFIQKCKICSHKYLPNFQTLVKLSRKHFLQAISGTWNSEVLKINV